MSRAPQLLRIGVAIVLAQVVLVLVYSILNIVNAETVARDVNKKHNESTTTTTMQEAGPPAPAVPETVTSPGQVRTLSIVFCVVALVEVGLCLLVLRRDNRARISLLILVGGSTLLLGLSFLSLGVAAATIYLFQFNREVRDWFLGPRDDGVVDA